MTLDQGARLGRYEILGRLGAGGMGEVYKARDARLDRFVAVKILLERVSTDSDRRLRFEREARLLASLNHPHICQLFDFGREDDMDFLVMEFLQGQTLAQRLESGPLPLEDALRVGLQIVDALDKAHRQGVIHRDVKPSNVMLGASGSKLFDFGLAKLRKTPLPPSPSATTQALGLTEPGAIIGTLQYSSPEQLEGLDADACTDIFAFGALIYEMISGRKAFTGRTQAAVISSIMSGEPESLSKLQPLTPPLLERVVNRCMAKRPEQRWQTAQALRMQLQKRWFGF